MMRASGMAMAAALGLGLALCTLTAARAVETAADQATAPAQSAWLVTCSNQNVAAKLRCKAEQALFVAKTRQRIVGMVFEADDGKQPFRAKVQLPHGIKLSSGLKLWVDDGEKRGVDVTFADAAGSYALFPVDDALANELRKGKAVRLQVETMAGKPTIFELKLDGIAAALKYVEEFK